MIILAKLLVKEIDTLGYVTYVFECLDKEVRKETKYMMCTRFKNWDHRCIDIGEIGYLNFIEIKAGIDKWFDGKELIPYNYNNVQFIKFIEKPKENHQEFIM